MSFFSCLLCPLLLLAPADQYGVFVSKPNYKVDSEACMCAEQKHSCEDDSVCINRAVYTECTRKCPNGDKCKNQRIARREYAKTAVVLVREEAKKRAAAVARWECTTLNAWSTGGPN